MCSVDDMQEELGRIHIDQHQRSNGRRDNQGAPRQLRAQPNPRKNYMDEDYNEPDYDEGGADRR